MPINQMLHRITLQMDLLIYPGCDAQTLLYSSSGKRPVVRIV